MSNTLLDELTKLDLEERSLKRNLDRYYRDEKVRTRLFGKISQIEKQKEKVKFKLKLERKLKNENSN